MSGHEEFAVSVLRLTGEIAGIELVKGNRPHWSNMEELRPRASSGERALLDLALEAWGNRPGSITSAFACVDKTTALAVLTALCDAYEPVLS